MITIREKIAMERLQKAGITSAVPGVRVLDTIEECIDLIERLQAQQAWQDISTAPRDWTPVLAWNGKQQMVVAFDARSGYWAMLDDRTCQDDIIPDHEPTHWKPLSESPK